MPGISTRRVSDESGACAWSREDTRTGPNDYTECLLIDYHHWFTFVSHTHTYARNTYTILGWHLLLIIGRVHFQLAQHLPPFSLLLKRSQNVRSLPCTWITLFPLVFALTALIHHTTTTAVSCGSVANPPTLVLCRTGTGCLAFERVIQLRCLAVILVGEAVATCVVATHRCLASIAPRRCILLMYTEPLCCTEENVSHGRFIWFQLCQYYDAGMMTFTEVAPYVYGSRWLPRSLFQRRTSWNAGLLWALRLPKCVHDVLGIFVMVPDYVPPASREHCTDIDLFECLSTHTSFYTS